MKKLNLFFCSLALLAALPLCIQAQDKNASQEEKHKAEEKSLAADKLRAEAGSQAAVASTPLKVKIVLTEYDGEKKTKSLPYIIYVNAPHATHLQPDWTRLRIGSRVPVYTGKDSYTYLDVGTSIDARAVAGANDQFVLQTNVERSWVEGEIPVATDGSAMASSDIAKGPFKQPIIQQFKFELNLTLKDGQTIESTTASDPLNGKVLRVETTVNIAK